MDSASAGASGPGDKARVGESAGAGWYKKIGDYGVIGDGETLALVGRDGAIDWMCLPYLDSPSVFAAILDAAHGGSFAVRPTGAWDSVQEYLPRTNVLRTQFRTAGGQAELTDFMPWGETDVDEASVEERPRLVRRVRGLCGRLRLCVRCSPRFDYGQTAPARTAEPVSSPGDDDAGQWVWQAGDQALSLVSNRQLAWRDERAEVEICEGETFWLALYEEPPGEPGRWRGFSAAMCERLFDTARDDWRAWSARGDTGKWRVRGFWRTVLDRAALALKLLQFCPTGAIAAAGTMGLPAIIHGSRNWDYRFSWIRDASLTIKTLFELGHHREANEYTQWLKAIIRAEGGQGLAALYQLREPSVPAGETTLEYLEGYKGSHPVHRGQFNVGQKQHDIYGELLEMFYAFSRYAGQITFEDWSLIRALVEHVVAIWREPDHGIWELRTGPHQLTHSKLMCWVALDRGIKIAGHYGFPGDLQHWQAEREALREDILEHGYCGKLGRFRQHYETDAIDASLLLIPLVGFLPADDPRVLRTVAAVQEELAPRGIVMRYTADDALPGQEHGFLFCQFWHICCLIQQGKLDDAEGLLTTAQRYGNRLGLMGEQYDAEFEEITGNFPQAFSHIGYASAVLDYFDARHPRRPPPKPSLTRRLKLLVQPMLLTPEETPRDVGQAPSQRIGQIMNSLQGHFYDSHEQRVDYALICDSDYYREFLDAVASLRRFDPRALADDSQRIAFWINVFNAMVVHGVIELGAWSTVRETPWFFGRICYQIGPWRFTPEDIRHGILRGNARPPYWPLRRFGSRDPRRSLCVHEPDPRIHFALVCGTRSCPPIVSYQPEAIGEQLETAARVAINSSTRVDQERAILFVSARFKWYRRDFEEARVSIPRFVAPYLYDRQLGDWVEQHADRLEVRHTRYDWRLNQ